MKPKQTEFPVVASVGAALLYIAAGILMLAAWFSPESASAETSPGEGAAPAAVEEGREALGSHRRYPWYDESDDGVRRVNVKIPWRAPDVDVNFRPRTAWNFSWLELFVWLGVLLLFGALAFLLIRAYLQREDVSATAATGASQKAAADDATRIEALPFRIRRGPLSLLEEARRHYEQGDLQQAIIYLFSYQLVEMDKQQIIRLAKGKTNRQYLREIRRRGPLQSLVGQTMVAFEDVFFGAHPLAPARFESCWGRLDEFESLIAEQAT
jgi:hypothetical protein